MVACGKCWRTRRSPSAFVRPYWDGLAGSAPIADICTSFCTPEAAASRATRPAPSAWIAAKSPDFRSARMPTRLTTMSAPSIARASVPSAVMLA